MKEKEQKKKCEVCSSEYIKKRNESKERWENRRFCGNSCSLKYQHKNNKRKAYVAGWNKGKKCPQWTGEKSSSWKGELAGYSAIHHWVNTHFKKPDNCENCNNKLKLTWANKDGKYSRERNDWLCLCYKCHKKFDKENPCSKRFDLTRKTRNKNSNKIMFNKFYAK